jgi:hypothetical protein
MPTENKGASQLHGLNSGLTLDKCTGYKHPDYALSLQEFGKPRELRRCGGWILERPIIGTPYTDAMGPYPLFSCQEWSQLHADLDEVDSNLVSIAMVVDPLAGCSLEYLRRCFKDIVIPFKHHFIVDLSQPLAKFVRRRHARYARRALERLSIEKIEEPDRMLDDWMYLYTYLIKIKDIKGIQAFSRASFSRQFSVPGLVMFRASHNEKTLGMTLWYVQKDMVYGHLTAFDPAGYDLHASHGLFWTSLEYFKAQGMRLLDLGGSAGLSEHGDDGLSTFKRGWSTGTVTAYFCGRILDRDKYAQIVEAQGVVHADFFPAYRNGLGHRVPRATLKHREEG